MKDQLVLPLYQDLSNKEVLAPLDIVSLNYYWNHKGFFNNELYEKYLISKENKNDKVPNLDSGGNNIAKGFCLLVSLPKMLAAKMKYYFAFDRRVFSD